MQREVTIHRVADRHADPHERDFAETRSETVADGDLLTVIVEALTVAGMDSEIEGKFVITVDWPHE